MIEKEEAKPDAPKAEEDDKVETKSVPPEHEMKIDPPPMGPR